MNLRAFRALTFDCYGTLIDWERGLLAELRPWAEKSGLRGRDEELLEAFGELESKQEAATPDRPYPEILAAVHRGLAERWGVSADERASAAFGRSVGRW